MGESPEIIEYTRQLAVFTRWLVIATFILATIAFGVGIWQAVISRQATRQQLRAYVFVEDILLIDSSQLTPQAGTTDLQINPPRPPNFPGLEWATKNSGQTPAYDVVHWGMIDVIENRHENTLVPPTDLASGPKTYIAAGSGTRKWMWFARALSQQEIADVIAGTRGIYVFGRINYRDAFGRKRHTLYRLRYSGHYPPIARPVFSYCDAGNEAK